MPRRTSSRVRSRTYTFMPPVSLPLSIASGQVCTLNIATRLIGFMLYRSTLTMINPGILGTSWIFVLFIAAQKIELAVAQLNASR
jgi:hypothetical protein